MMNPGTQGRERRPLPPLKDRAGIGKMFPTAETPPPGGGDSPDVDDDSSGIEDLLELTQEKESSIELKEKPTAEDSIEERERREANLERYLTMKSIDSWLFGGLGEAVKNRNIEHLKDMPGFIEEVKKAEHRLATYYALVHGKELDKKTIGEPGVNSITLREYEGDPERFGYVKSMSGEEYITIDESTDPITGYKVIREWDEEKGDFVTTRTTDEKTQRLAEREFKQRENRLQLFASYYDIPVDEVPIHFKKMSYRYGIETGTLPTREVVVSRINEMIGWDSVPMTVLRKTEDGNDLLSVQEGVQGSDPDVEPHVLYDYDMHALAEEGPEHPGAESMMRLACFDYLIGSSDRHQYNIIYDEANQTFHGIDNGLSFGMSQFGIDGPESPDMINSVPREIIQEHEDWKLDDKAIHMLKSFAKEVNEGRPQESLKKMFALMFGHYRHSADTHLQYKPTLLLMKRLLFLNQNI